MSDKVPTTRVMTRAMAKKLGITVNPSTVAITKSPVRSPARKIVDTVKKLKKRITEKKADKGKEETAKPSLPPILPTPTAIRDLKKKVEEKKALANQLYSEKEYEKALEIYTEAIYWCPQTPDCAVLYSNRCACYMMLYQYSNAIEDAKKCLQLDPKFVQACRRLVKCYLTVGDLEETEFAVEMLKRLEPPEESVNAELKLFATLKTSLLESERAYVEGNYQKVVSSMDVCCEISPFCSRFKVMRAEGLALMERYFEAEVCAKDILNSDKQNFDAIYIKAYCLYYQNYINQAFEDFQKILNLAPDHKKALETYNRARLLQLRKAEADASFKAGNYQKSWELYNEALFIDPKCVKINAKLYFNKALIALKIKNSKEAIIQCCEAIRLENEYVKAIFLRAKCYMNLKEYDLAVLDLEKAWKLDKSDEIRHMLHRAKQEQKKLEEKKNYLKDYYKILGITKTATTDDVVKAYRKKALIHHLDKHHSASAEEKKIQEKKFKEVGEAYAVLSDPVKRNAYDLKSFYNIY